MQLTTGQSFSADNALPQSAFCLTEGDQCDHTQQQALQLVRAMLAVLVDIGTARQTLPARFATAAAVQAQLSVPNAPGLVLQAALWDPSVKSAKALEIQTVVIDARCVIARSVPATRPEVHQTRSCNLAAAALFRRYWRAWCSLASMRTFVYVFVRLQSC